MRHRRQFYRRRTDHYDTLGVERDASETDIHSAYRTLARQLHPDGGRGDAARMAAVNDAWHVLGDESRRAAYDAEPPPVAPHVHFAPTPVPAATTRLIRLMIIALALLVTLTFAGILINGFGGMHG